MSCCDDFNGERNPVVFSCCDDLKRETWYNYHVVRFSMWRNLVKKEWKRTYRAPSFSCCADFNGKTWQVSHVVMFIFLRAPVILPVHHSAIILRDFRRAFNCAPHVGMI